VREGHEEQQRALVEDHGAKRHLGAGRVHAEAQDGVLADGGGHSGEAGRVVEQRLVEVVGGQLEAAVDLGLVGRCFAGGGVHDYD
jgi:hypothetical protein